MAEGLVVAGTLSCNMGGKSLSVKGNAKINLGFPLREDLDAATGAVGFKEKAQTASLEFETIKGNATTLKELATFTGNITYTTRDGAAYVFEGAWAQHEGALETEEATVALVFKALSAHEVAAS